MIDTHAHLNSSRFKKDREGVVAAAQAAGVTAVIVPGTDLKDSRLAVELAAEHESIYAAVGVHPSEASAMLETDWIELENLLRQPKVVAVGEIGLDGHYEDGITQAQIECFEKQLKIAVKAQKPVIIHSRESTVQMLSSLQSCWDESLQQKVVFHCCEADEALLSFALEHGFYIGIDGDITYGPEKEAFIQKAPLEMLLLETDSPYLLPEPLRSKKAYPNVPANLLLIAEAVARVKNEPIEKVMHMTTENAQRLFGSLEL